MKQFVQGNDELLGIRKNEEMQQKERKGNETENEKKLREIYSQHLKETKKENDRLKRIMKDSLLRQMKHKMQKEREYKEENTNMRFATPNSVKRYPGSDYKKTLPSKTSDIKKKVSNFKF